MTIYTLNDRRINIHAPFQTPSGIRYANLTDPAVRAAVGVVELTEPQPPEDYTADVYQRRDYDHPPYVAYERKSDEQLATERRTRLLGQIADLEATSGLPRVAREFMLISMEREALAAGFTLEQLRASHYGYRKVKELDEQVTALRNQL